MAEGDRDWTKPAALAIPKEGCFELERGRVWPGVPQDSGLLWVLHHCEGEGGPRGRGAGVRKDHRGDHRGESGGVGAAATALPALAAVSTSDRDCTSNTRASSTPTSTSTPRTRCSCSARPASRRCSPISKDSPRIGRRSRRRSSTSSGNIRCRVSWSTASTHR
jgi:hypothetical protein